MEQISSLILLIVYLKMDDCKYLNIFIYCMCWAGFAVTILLIYYDYMSLAAYLICAY